MSYRHAAQGPLACQECNVNGSGGDNAWSAKLGTCVIAGACFTPGAGNPSSPECQRCEIDISDNTWTPAVDGTTCTGGHCQSGVCKP